MSDPAQKRGGLWRKRNFSLFWTGETTSELGNAVAVVALPLVAVELLHSGIFVITLLTAVRWVPWLVIGVPAGAWIDRLPTRPVMLVCDLISVLAFASVPIAVHFQVLTVGQLIAVAVITGAASVFFSTAYQVMLAAILDEKDLTEGNAKLTGSRSAAQLGGPGLGGALAQLAGAASGMLADAVTFAVSFACLCAMRLPDRHPRKDAGPRSSFAQDIMIGLRFLWHDPYLRAQTMFAAVVNLTLTGVDSLIVVFLARTVRVPDAELGWLIAAFGVGGILGAFAARPIGRRFGTSRAMLLVTIGFLPLGLFLPLTQAGPGVGFAIVANLATSFGVVAANIIGASFRQAYVPADILGRVSSAVMTAAFTATPAGALLAGLLATDLGIRATMAILASGTAAASLIFLLTPMRHLRDLPQRPPDRVLI